MNAWVLGTTMGRYEVLEELGRGGMGAVYRARDPQLRREVAIKVLRVGPGADLPEMDRRRLVREAQALARLADPHVVAIYDVRSEGDRLFIVMEYVRGPTLRAWLDQAPRAWPEVLEVMLQAARGLSAAHRAGLVHRDFKPTNVLVGEDPTASALSGELTRAGTVVGTPPYMAPEQHRGWTADAATDQFAFCVALWEALFGVRPFVGRDAMGQIRRLLTETAGLGLVGAARHGPPRATRRARARPRLDSRQPRVGPRSGGPAGRGGAAGGHRTAVELWTLALGGDHPAVAAAHDNLATTHNNLATVDYEAGNYDEAQRRFEEAAILFERGLGPEHPSVAIPLENVAASRIELGRPEDAAAPLARAPRTLALVRLELAEALWTTADDPDPAARAEAVAQGRSGRRDFRGPGDPGRGRPAAGGRLAERPRLTLGTMVCSPNACTSAYRGSSTAWH